MLHVHLLPPGLPQLQIPAVHQQDEADVFRVIALPSAEVWHGSVSGSRSAPPIGVCSSIMSEKSQKFTHPDLLTTIVLASVSALNLPGPAFSCPVYVSYHKNCQMPRSAPRLRPKGLYISNPTPFSTLLQFLNLSCPLHGSSKLPFNLFFFLDALINFLQQLKCGLPQKAVLPAVFANAVFPLIPLVATGPQGLGSISLFFSASFRSIFLLPQTYSFDTHVIRIRPFIWMSIRYEEEIKGTDIRKGRNKIIFVHR